MKLPAGDRQGCQVAAFAAGDGGAHLPQRAAHPSHRSAPQGGIAREHEMAAGPAGQQPQHQPHRGAGVAAIEHALRFAEAIEAHALHDHLAARLDRAHRHAHRPQAGGGAEWILGGQQTFDAGFAFGNGAKQQGAMGDRLVARHPHLPRQASRGTR